MAAITTAATFCIQAKAQRITLNLQNVPVKEAMSQLKRVSGFSFVFFSEDVNTANTVSVKADNAPVEQVVTQILSGQPELEFQIQGKEIMVNKRYSNGSGDIQWDEQTPLRGRVVDENQTPLIGAAVMKIGSQNVALSDTDGYFILSNVKPGDPLSVAYLGFNDEVVDASDNMVIVMREQLEYLDQVVVIGYGTQKKSDLTGSISSANLDFFKEAQNTNIMQSLKGSVPGLQISQTNHSGEDVAIQIRGVNTLSGNENPLIIVDEVIFSGNLSDLNPNDIKSVDILKDASSKAIYGSQAANGVLLITTNSGRIRERPTLSYSGSVSFQTPTKPYRLENALESIERIKGVYYDKAYTGANFNQPNPSWDWKQTELVPEILTGIEKGEDYNWWDALTSPGISTNHSIALKGGSEKSSYYLSGGYTNVKGFVLNDNYKRATARINLNTKYKEWLKIGANAYGAFTDYSGVSPSYGSIVLTSPFVTPYHPNGELIIYPKGVSTTHLNPFLDVKSNDKNLQNRISALLYATLDIPWVSGLKYRLNYDQSYSWTDTGRSSVYGASLTGSASKGHSGLHEETFDNILSYEHAFHEHTINVTLVYGYRKAAQDQTSAIGEQYSNLSLSYNSLEQAVIQKIASSAWSENQLYQMARVNYNYKNRYLLTGTVRRDGFSGFAAKHKFGIFPSVAAAWTISNEPFFKLKFVDFLKIKASFGKNGNQTARYSSLAVVEATKEFKYVFGDGGTTSIGKGITSLANSGLRWEETVGINLGLDFAIANNRINGSLDYYKTTTNNLLWDRILPMVTGFDKIKSNIGEIQNSGLEFALNVNPVHQKNFDWNFHLSLFTNWNKVTHLLGDVNGDGVEDDLVSSGLFIGKSIGTIYDYQEDGIYQVTDEIPKGYNAGNYRILDTDGVEGVTADDRIFIGKKEPALTIGFQNSLTFKNITLRFFVHSILGGKNSYLGQQSFDLYYSTGNFANANVYTYYDYWSVTNPDAKYAVNYRAGKISASKYCSRSFARLQDLSLAYQFGEKVTKALGIGGLKVYVSGKNLLTITSWDGWDPETGQGIGTWDPYPVMKSVSLGIDVSF